MFCTKWFLAVTSFTAWFHLTRFQTQPEEHPLLEHKDQYFEFERNSSILVFISFRLTYMSNSARTSRILQFNFCQKQLFCSEQVGFVREGKSEAQAAGNIPLSPLFEGQAFSRWGILSRLMAVKKLH